MASVEVIEASGKSYCRGSEKNCLCKFPKKIPEKAKALKIHIYGAGGGATAFYCEVCMVPVLESFRDVLDKV